MPVRIVSNTFRYDHPSSLAAAPPRQAHETLRIGLVNNMPEAAFQATERQFLSLLDAASGEITIHLSLYTLTADATLTRESLAGRPYASVESLWNAGAEACLDGLIVTGAEPLKPSLQEEPYWHSLLRVLEWARENTCSTVWSCLAAHAAVLHLDNIERCRNVQKHFGVLRCEGVAAHRLTEEMPTHSFVPHSRWNGLPETQLEASGYRILTRTADAGVDTFVKEGKSLFVFLQGHPEYETDTLLREYRRDVSRFLRGETKSHPLLPRGYFDRETAEALAALRDAAVSLPDVELPGSVASALERAKIENTWRSTAVCLYRNWLELIRERRQTGKREGQIETACSVSR